MIKAVLFDMDGVLVDSAEANSKYFTDILNMNGYNLMLTPDLYKKKYYPMSAFQILKSLLPDVSDERINEMLKFSYDGYEKYMILHNYVKEVLESLSRKHRLGVVTNRRRAGVDTILKNFDLEKYFEVLIRKEDVVNPKPHPEPLLMALEKLKIKPEDAVYIGDNEVDVQTAKAAAVKVIIFSENKIEEADYNINSLIKILDIIKAIK